MVTDREHLESEGLDRLVPKIFSLIPANAETFLDVGCGMGIVSEAVKNNFNAKVYGLDCFSPLLERAKKRGIITFNCNVENDKFPFLDANFDCILLIEVLEHLGKLENCFSEIARVIKPNGKLVLSTPNLTQLGSRLQILRGNDPSPVDPKATSYGRHVRLYALNTLKQVLAPWFHISKVIYFNEQPRRSWKGVIRDGLCFLKKDLSSEIIVLCEPVAVT